MEPTQQHEGEMKHAPAEATVSKPAEASTNMTLSIPAAIIIAGLMISASIVLTHFWGKTATTDTVKAPTASIKDVKIEGEPFIGKADAPALAYYSDYQCPFCKKFDETILPTIRKEYVDTGKLKIVFKDFTFLGPDSDTAALFGRAVWALYPDQYFAWREAMFASQDDEGSVGFGDRASIEALTRKIAGIDQAKVSAAVDAHAAEYKKSADADYEEGQTIGVTGTPSIIFGKQIMGGLYPMSAYTEALEKQF